MEIVDFDAAAFNGGIINPGKILPSDLGRRVPRDKRLPHERTIKVRCKAMPLLVMIIIVPQAIFLCTIDNMRCCYAGFSVIFW